MLISDIEIEVQKSEPFMPHHGFPCTADMSQFGAKSIFLNVSTVWVLILSLSVSTQHSSKRVAVSQLWRSYS